MKSESLNLLEPSGPVQACNGIALPLGIPFIAIFLHAALERVHGNGCVALCHKKVGLLWCIMVIHQSCKKMDSISYVYIS